MSGTVHSQWYKPEMMLMAVTVMNEKNSDCVVVEAADLCLVDAGLIPVKMCLHCFDTVGQAFGRASGL